MLAGLGDRCVRCSLRRGCSPGIHNSAGKMRKNSPEGSEIFHDVYMMNHDDVYMMMFDDL